MLCLLPPWSANHWPSPTSTLESCHLRLYSLSHIHCGSHWSSLTNISLQLIHQTHPELLFQCVCQLTIIMVTGVIYLCSWFRLGLTMTRSIPNSMVVSCRGNFLFGRWRLEFLSLTFFKNFVVRLCFLLCLFCYFFKPHPFFLWYNSTFVQILF